MKLHLGRCNFAFKYFFTPRKVKSPMKHIIVNTLSQSGFIMLNKVLIKRLESLELACLLSFLIDKWSYFGYEDFYYTIDSLEKDTLLSDRKIRNGIKNLIKLGILIKKDFTGLPPKQYYNINCDLLIEILNKSYFVPLSVSDNPSNKNNNSNPCKNASVETCKNASVETCKNASVLPIIYNNKNNNNTERKNTERKNIYKKDFSIFGDFDKSEKSENDKKDFLLSANKEQDINLNANSELEKVNELEKLKNQIKSLESDLKAEKAKNDKLLKENKKIDLRGNSEANRAIKEKEQESKKKPKTKKELYEYAIKIYNEAKKTNPNGFYLSNSAWLSWVEYKLLKERKITHFTFDLNLKQLIKLGIKADEAINQSISKNWSGIFEVKTYNNDGSPYTTEEKNKLMFGDEAGKGDPFWEQAVVGPDFMLYMPNDPRLLKLLEEEEKKKQNSNDENN